jgi:biopolymer transport protein ExbD
MIREKAIGGRLVQGLRTKYFPKSRINQGLISVGPWINIILLIIMFLMLNGRLVVQSGYTVDLPRSGAVSGVRPSLVAIIKHFDAAGNIEAGERVFFNDDSFVLGNERQMSLLHERLRESLLHEDDASLLLFADKDVSNETLARIFFLLREAGIESVSLAVSQE